eukprot:scaffold13617_cov112-Isochrysis_galbana.AAC.1
MELWAGLKDHGRSGATSVLKVTVSWRLPGSEAGSSGRSYPPSSSPPTRFLCVRTVPPYPVAWQKMR